MERNSEMSDMKIVSVDKYGIMTTEQEFERNGEKCFIINRGPYKVKHIGRLGMRLRKLRGLSNYDKGIEYES
jgi:hypothetical protein